MLIVDERSMISCELLSAFVRNLSMTIYGGLSKEKEFGGIPIIIIIGDDSQLPPVIQYGKGKGAFYVFDKKSTSRKNATQLRNEYTGKQLFQRLAETVMQLSIRKRQHDDEFLVSILDDLESGDPSFETASMLMKYHVRNLPIDERKNIESKSTYIFTTHKAKDDHNFRQLYKVCNKDNPLACLKYQDMNNKAKGCRINHFNHRSTPMITHLCIGAKVTIKGRNFETKWGLYSGAIGIVREIVFEKDCNPNLNDLPVYVAVEFPSFNLPENITSFDKYNRKV